MEYLKSSGVQKVRIKIFRGIYNGKYYPNAFNMEEKELIKSMESDYPEIEILFKNHKYNGRQCRAGKDFFIMDRKGNLQRCSNTFKNLWQFSGIDNGKRSCSQTLSFKKVRLSV